MENITRALIMAFSMLVFVIGFSYAMYLINGLTATSSTLLETVTTTKYYDNIEVSSDIATRDVGVETIIPTLYRYYKENYAVKILDQDGNVIQIFDLSLENKIAKAAAYEKNTDKELMSLKKSIYNNETQKAYMFKAPWVGSEENIIARIDYFLNGTNGYIKNALVNYENTIGEGGFLKQYGDSVFEESFVEYAYSGETISTEDGLETITGSTQESSKIIITYKVKE